MNVLITRPSGHSAPLDRMLQQAGLHTTLQPLLEIHPLPLDAHMRQQLLDLDRFNAVVVISPNAAHYGVEVIESLWPQMPIEQPWFANGQGTAQVLAEAGILAETPTTGTTTEDLLAMPRFHNIDGQRWLIIGGEGGRPVLFESLQARGAIPVKWAAYQRTCPKVDPTQFASQLAQVDVVLMSSSEALENLHQIAASTKMDCNAMLTKTLVVSSERLVQVARNLGWTHIVLAAGASNQQLTDAVLNHIR